MKAPRRLCPSEDGDRRRSAEIEDRLLISFVARWRRIIDRGGNRGRCRPPLEPLDRDGGGRSPLPGSYREAIKVGGSSASRCWRRRSKWRLFYLRSSQALGAAPRSRMVAMGQGMDIVRRDREQLSKVRGSRISSAASASSSMQCIGSCRKRAVAAPFSAILAARGHLDAVADDAVYHRAAAGSERPSMMVSRPAGDSRAVGKLCRTIMRTSRWLAEVAEYLARRLERGRHAASAPR